VRQFFRSALRGSSPVTINARLGIFPVNVRIDWRACRSAAAVTVHVLITNDVSEKFAFAVAAVAALDELCRSIAAASACVALHPNVFDEKRSKPWTCGTRFNLWILSVLLGRQPHRLEACIT